MYSVIVQFEQLGTNHFGKFELFMLMGGTLTRVMREW